jgi:hypothetical protein
MTGVGTLLTLMMLGSGSGSVSLPADATKRPVRSISSAVDLAEKWGVVTSLKRSPAQNRAVGGAPNSFHLSGRAIDIARRPGVRHSEIDQAFRKAGYALVESLDEGDHSHFAFGVPDAAPALSVSKPVQVAASAAEPDACAEAPASQIVRRRPDRSDGCDTVVEPTPRLRPLPDATD